MPDAQDRHARWSVANIFDARDADLVCSHGNQVKATLDTFGGWHVFSGSERVDTGSAMNTAAVLNHYGVLPRREHETLVLGAEHA